MPTHTDIVETYFKKDRSQFPKEEPTEPLTPDEEKELEILRNHQSNPNRPLSQDEFDRIGVLARKQHHFYTTDQKPKDEVVDRTVISEATYWKVRCGLMEDIESENPCDPDITSDQIKAYNAYNKFISHYGDWNITKGGEE